MFESDDFDEFALPDAAIKDNQDKRDSEAYITKQPNSLQTCSVTTNPSLVSYNNKNYKDSTHKVSPNRSKRKIINSHFDHNSKRKFPGPAGLLMGNLEDDPDDSVSHLELLSQDVNFTQNPFSNGFESPIWQKLINDIKQWNLREIDTINAIKQQAIIGKLRHRKAQIVIALVEAVDRSPTDPLVILRDTTGHIKCTLHRDAWSTFSSYIVPEHCALVLWKPTILTTGSTFKKHYLNITLSNIHALYSSVVIENNTENNVLPDDYCKSSNEGVTVFRTEKHIQAELQLNAQMQHEERIKNSLQHLYKI